MEIKLIIERLFVFFKVKTHAQLAERLGVSTTTLSNWKKRNTIDFPLLFTKCENANLNWLVFGKEETEGGYYVPGEGIQLINEPATDYYKTIINAKEEIIQTQKKYISFLEAELNRFREEKEKPAEDDGQKRKTA